MGGHVVGTFVIMRVPGVLGRDAIKPAHHIAAHFSCGIFLYRQGCRGVTAEYREQAGADALRVHPPADRLCDLVQSLSGCGDEDFGGSLFHAPHMAEMSQLQPDLFGAPPCPVEGLSLHAGMVTSPEETELCARIDEAPLEPFAFQGWLGKRLTASFGSSYDYARGRVLSAPPIPDWLISLRARMAQWAGLPSDALVQALVIRYDPGAGIGWHRDRPQYGTILGLSLGAPETLRLRRRRADGGFDRRSVPLAPRAAYGLEGLARWEWEHSITPVEQRRWSITFRSFRDQSAQ